MTPQIDYSLATIHDIPALIALRIEFLTELFGEQSSENILALANQLATYFDKHITDGTYYCYLAKSGDEIAGIGGIIIRERPGGFKPNSGLTGYILNMYTKEGFRKMGIGKEILHRLVSLGKNLGIGQVELHATEQGESLYRNYGFKPPNSLVLEFSCE